MKLQGKRKLAIFSPNIKIEKQRPVLSDIINERLGELLPLQWV